MMQNESLQEDFSDYSRKLENFDDTISQLNQQTNQATDILGSNSQARGNQRLAEEMKSRQMTAQAHFEELLEEAKSLVKNERLRLEDEREELYQQRGRLLE
jgi:hypothetical protein